MTASFSPCKGFSFFETSFAFGAILSVSSAPTLTYRVQTIALSKAQAIATSAMQLLGKTLGLWTEQRPDAALKVG
ncbi:hypothetical protein [Altericista sp. CCNU0014]|uniref:hypothetical protein n=1 Tax=Altericista sp. CCNU0014 TaxID=3082949 RepID=UPI00384AAA83